MMIIFCIMLLMCCIPMLQGMNPGHKDLVLSQRGLRLHKDILNSLGENALPAKPYVIKKNGVLIRGYGFIAREDGNVCGNLFLTEIAGYIVQFSLESYALTKQGNIVYNRSDWKNNPAQKLYDTPFFDEKGNFCFLTSTKSSSKGENVVINQYFLLPKSTRVDS